MGLRGFENHGFNQSFAVRFIRLKSRPFSYLVELLNMCLLLGCRVDAVLRIHRCAYVPYLALQNSIRSCIRSTSREITSRKACHWQVNGSGQVVRLCMEACGRSIRTKYCHAVHGCCTNLPFTYQGISISTYMYPVPCTLYILCTCIHAMQNHKQATIPAYTPTTDSFVDRLDWCAMYPASTCTYADLSTWLDRNRISSGCIAFCMREYTDSRRGHGHMAHRQ